ncbi:MAG: type IV pilus twitching motility protein PilT [bacterium]
MAEIEDIDELLHKAVQRRASDVHITAGLPPVLRIDGRLVPSEYDRVLPPTSQKLIYSMLTDQQKQAFEENLELDFSYGVAGLGRFRVNIFLQRGSIGAVMRSIPSKIPTLDELRIPGVVKNLTMKPRGLILVTGPTGCGKSTTLAACIDMINSARDCHIITIEDPIEYLHRHKKSMINQRELELDTRSFARALRSVLREDPDVILIGEMRDLETMEAALTIAETGHLVFATLHTNTAAGSIDRIVDVFPPHQQTQIRTMIAMNLEAVVTQQLLPRVGGKGRVPAVEILIATPGVRNLVRENKAHQIPAAIQTGGAVGMQTMDQALKELYSAGLITYQDAMNRSFNPDDLRKLIHG